MGEHHWLSATEGPQAFPLLSNLGAKGFQRPIIFTHSLTVWHTQKVIWGHRSTERVKVFFIFLSHFCIGTQVSKTHPEKEGDQLWANQRSYYYYYFPVTPGWNMMSPLGVLNYEWIFSVAILLKYTNLWLWGCIFSSLMCVLNTFSIPGMVSYSELQKQPKLNFCPQGALSSE